MADWAPAASPSLAARLVGRSAGARPTSGAGRRSGAGRTSGAGAPTGPLYANLVIYPAVILMGCFGFWIVFSATDPGSEQ